MAVFLCGDDNKEHEVLFEGDLHPPITSQVQHQGRKQMDRIPLADQKKIQSVLVPLAEYQAMMFVLFCFDLVSIIFLRSLQSAIAFKLDDQPVKLTCISEFVIYKYIYIYCKREYEYMDSKYIATDTYIKLFSYIQTHQEKMVCNQKKFHHVKAFFWVMHYIKPPNKNCRMSCVHGNLKF